MCNVVGQKSFIAIVQVQHYFIIRIEFGIFKMCENSSTWTRLLSYCWQEHIKISKVVYYHCTLHLSTMIPFSFPSVELTLDYYWMLCFTGRHSWHPCISSSSSIDGTHLLLKPPKPQISNFQLKRKGSNKWGLSAFRINFQLRAIEF